MFNIFRLLRRKSQASNPTPKKPEVKKFKTPCEQAQRDFFAKNIKHFRDRERSARQGTQNGYLINRGLDYMPFKPELLSCLRGFLSSPGIKVRVLEKGPGAGAFSSTLKEALGKDADRVEITTIGLTPSLRPEHRKNISHARVGIGLNMKSPKKFHLIVDFIGEDYYLPLQGLVVKSIGKSLSLLERRGELFTVLHIKEKPPGYFSEQQIDDLTNYIGLKDFTVKYSIYTQDDHTRSAIIHAKAMD